MLGIALLLGLVAAVAHKLHAGKGAELLWICYPSAAILCGGLIFRRAMAASVGGLFYLAVGLPFWLIDVVATGTTTWPSLFVHLIAPVAAVQHFRGVGVPAAAKYWAVPVYFAVSALSRAFTPPALNVNLVFGPYFPVPVAAWAAYIFNCVSGFGLLFAVEKLVNRSIGRSAMPART